MSKLKSGSRVFAAEHGEELCRFLAEAQTFYVQKINLPQLTDDGGSKIVHSRGPWHCVDQWYGGEPYSGMTTVFYEGVACFNMVYFGRLMPYAKRPLTVMSALMEALSYVSEKHPWRGPAKFTCSYEHLLYINKWAGSVRRFQGNERILSNGREVLYEATYIGGIINKD